MSFFDDSSLAFLPSGAAGKDGKAYSIKPTNGTGDFTFSRGSDLAATRVGPTGLIEKGRENLAKYSNDFSNAVWANRQVSVTPNATTAPDGSNTASKIVEDTTAAVQHRLDQTTTSSSGVKTFSVYLKQGGRTTSWVRVGLSGFYIDLTDGNTSSVSANIIAKVTPLANDWYRVSATKTDASANEILRINVGTGDSDGDGTSGIFVWRAQYEEGLAATDYIESGATTGKAGLLEDEPRFDYSGGATCPSLLLEPSRTNLVTQSEYFNATDHILNTNISVTNNATTSPEGLQNAAEITFDSNVARGLASLTYGDYSSQTHSVSIWAKSSGGVQNVRLKLTAGGVADYFSSNFQLTNEWQRLEFSQAFGATTTSNIQGGIVNGTGETTGTAYIYGLQLEANASYPTSYIPNHSGGSATRTGDVCNGAGDASAFNNSEGVLYAEISALADDLTFRTIQISDGTQDNRVLIRYRTSSNRFNFLLSAGGSVVLNQTPLVTDITDVHKAAIAYKSGDIRLYIDGVQISSFTDTFVISGLDDLSFNRDGVADVFYGNVKQVLVFPEALSDADCITLTT